MRLVGESLPFLVNDNACKYNYFGELCNETKRMMKFDILEGSR